MTTRAGRAIGIVMAAALVLPEAAAATDGPRLLKGSLQRRAMAGSLESTVQALSRETRGVFWVGYAAPMIEGDRTMCCFESIKHIERGDCGGCHLEKQESFSINNGGGPGRGSRLEGADEFFVLTRVKEGEVVKVRAFSLECPLDPGSVPLYWLGSVGSAESVRWLAKLVEDDDRHHDGPGEHALTALALHRGTEADRLLASYIKPGVRMRLREQAAFWIGNSRGRAGYEMLRAALRDDESSEFRKKVIFALSQNDTPEATDEILTAAKRDRDSDVRGEALFWLAQKAGEKAARTLTEAIDEDPDTDVKKKAVFGLSQLPAEEGVPLLIDLVRRHRNPAVRKEAIFWLGQSGDERALAFIEEILSD